MRRLRAWVCGRYCRVRQQEKVHKKKKKYNLFTTKWFSSFFMLLFIFIPRNKTFSRPFACGNMKGGWRRKIYEMNRMFKKAQRHAFPISTCCWNLQVFPALLCTAGRRLNLFDDKNFWAEKLNEKKFSNFKYEFKIFLMFIWSCKNSKGDTTSILSGRIQIKTWWYIANYIQK